MKLTGNLKKIVYNSKTREEAKTAIEDAGMILNDEELDKVSGGHFKQNECRLEYPYCPHCGKLAGDFPLDHSENCCWCGEWVNAYEWVDEAGIVIIDKLIQDPNIDPRIL